VKNRAQAERQVDEQSHQGYDFIAGLTPFEALVTTTRNPAIFLGRFQEAGTVAPGKVADLVLLDGNPLKDIANTRKISGVVLRGRWLDHPQLEKIEQEVVAHFAAE